MDQEYDISSCLGVTDLIAESMRITKPGVVLLSLIGSNYNYAQILHMFKEKYETVPVITIGTEYESSPYAGYYKLEQFHKVLRPVSGQEVLRLCNSLLGVETLVEEDDSKQPHILLVDDNAQVLRSVKALLDDRYSVAVAASGAQAFVAIGKKKPDLILLDYEMPKLDGEATLEMIQTNEELKDIPVVFLTGASSKDVVTKLLALKPAGYVLKPVDKELLVNTIEKQSSFWEFI